MDYSVGSLSDLITGSNTPNKKKVVKKQLFQQKSTKQYKKRKSTSKVSQKPSENAAVFKKKDNNEILIEGKVPKKRRFVPGGDNEPPVKRVKKTECNGVEEVNQSNNENPESLKRTVFVGNVPLTSNTKKLKKLFMQYGKIESVRIRGVPVANPQTPKKVAAIKKDFHPERKSFYAFIRFENAEDATKAVEANGTIYRGHHLRVQLCEGGEKPDENKAIFVGNLSFYAEEDDLWKTFDACGAISSVRIVRDGKTGMGKGFGYVNFKNSDSVTLALEMENVKLKDRELRIKLCNAGAEKKNKGQKNTKKELTHKQLQSETRVRNSDKAEMSKGTTDKREKKGSFQGAKFVAKKKKNFNKVLLQKKKLIKQIAPK